jgi:hypothetical integral membrane protein (TIGR02206 family)
MELELFGSLHLRTLLALAGFGFVVIYPAKRWMNADTRDQWAIGLGSFMIVMEFLDRGYQIILLDESIKDNLPLHLCGIGVFLGAALLFFRNYRVFEILYFWGLVGAAQSIFTPDLEVGNHVFLFITYFLSHWMIILAVLYMIIIYDFRPTWDSLRRAFIALNLFTLCVAPINLLLDTNYLFICEKPGSATLLDVLGPWPWYILSLEVVGLLFFMVFYSPYAIADLIRSKRNSQPERGA